MGVTGAGRLSFSDSYAEAAEFAEVHFLAVGTPQRKGELAADLQYVDSVIESLVPLAKKPILIIGKSTVPVGTATRLREHAQLLSDRTVEIAWNPEFLREGHAVEDTLRPDRIVVGYEEDAKLDVQKIVRDIYHSAIGLGTPFVLTDLATAELVKAAANAFLATKISFINAIAEVCEAAGADVTQLADAIGYDERIGRKFLNAGIGFGGGCLPKDIRAFMARSGELGAGDVLTLLREVDNINMRARSRMVELARQVCEGSFVGYSVAILGTAFKPNSDDVRDSPALNIAGQIHLQGATVTIYDPKAMANSQRSFPTLSYATSVLDACSGADLVMVLTEWDEFKEIVPSDLGRVVRRKRIIDGRNCLDREHWIDADWQIHGVGK